MDDPDVCLAALLDACATQDREAMRSHLSDLYQRVVMGGPLPHDPRKLTTALLAPYARRAE